MEIKILNLFITFRFLYNLIELILHFKIYLKILNNNMKTAYLFYKTNDYKYFNKVQQ
jgi:hypothetical protein